MAKTVVSKPERRSCGGWQDKLLAANINSVHKSRTCDVFFMVEHNESCSPAVDKFKAGGKVDPINALKPVDYEDILKNVEKFSQDANNNASEGVLYHNVAREAANHLHTDPVLPCELLALLIKMQIVILISEDVAMTQKRILWERDLDNERAALVQSTEPKGKDKKGKDKKDKAKGKDKKGAKKTEEKVYDVCDSNYELKPKVTSTLAKEKRDGSARHETVEVDPKHLFVVIAGFYDFNIIEELFKVGVAITGVVELTKPSTKIDSLISGERDEPENDSVESQMSGSESSQAPSLASQEIQSIGKQDILYNFWRKIYEHLEGDDGCPEFLNNTIHITVSLPDTSFDESTPDDRHCLNVFSDIGSQIVKLPDIQRQHINYIRNLKICPVGPKPPKAPPSDFQLYNKIVNAIPPDCLNVFTVVYALVEEVGQRVPDPPQIVLKTPPSTVTEELGTTGTESLVENSLLDINSRVYRGIKGEIAKILNQNLRSHCSESGDGDGGYRYDPQMDLKVSHKAFLVQENNDIEIMVNSYRKLKSQLLDVNIKKLLVSNQSVLLWKRYPCIEEEQQKVLTKIYALQGMADTLDLPTHELQYVIHTILFNSFTCCNHKNNTQNDSGSYQLMFPRKNSSTSPNVIKQHIPNEQTMEPLETSEENFEVHIPHVEYLDEPNLYEAKNLCTYKWYETLSVLVTLQELYKAEQNYLCLDYKYCTFDDSILLRYHNDVDEFGINTTTWRQSLRTPIATLREFCKYVIHVESKWLEQEEEKYIEESEKQLERAIEEDRKIKQQYYPDLIFSDRDFIQRGSLKGRMIEELKKPVLPLQQADKKGGKGDKKDKKSKDASSKGKGKESKGTSGKAKFKSEKSGPASQILALEKLSKPTIPPATKKLSLRCAKEEEPFSFYAYDVSDSRVELTGSTTVFHSQDGFKVTVDQARFVGKPKKLSLNIRMNDHSLILHHHQAATLEPFTFHFALSDRTVIAFAKPLQTPPPEEKLGEKICQALKRKNDEKRQAVYFVSKKQRSVLKCFNIPYVTRRNLVLSEDLMIPFLNQLSIRGIKTRLVPTETLGSSEIQKFEEALGESNAESRSFMSQNETANATVRSKHTYDVISKIADSETVEEQQETEERVVEEAYARARRSLSEEDSIGTIPQRKSNKKLLRKIRQAVESHLPLFKICSSRLHKHQYVKRIKSRVEIQIGTVLKRIPCKFSLYKPKINLEISKLLPVKPRDSKPNPPCYDVRISLPSGLSVQSIEGTEGSPFNIRQRYFDKGPQCKNISHEYSRTFTRNGNIIIKKCDGNVDVLGAGGQKVKCEIPYLKVKSTPRGKKCPNRRGNDLIPLHTSSLTKFQKQLNRSINRLRKHLIDGYDGQHLISHRSCQRWKKNYIKDPNQIHILQSSIGTFKKFSLITSDGSKLKVTPSTISEEKIYYTSTATDYRYQEQYYGREDGTHSIINHESLLVTQFPDGTRLTTWIETDRDLLFMEEQEEKVEGNTRDTEQQVYEFDLGLGKTLDLLESVSEEDTLARLSTMTFNSENYTERESNKSVKNMKPMADDVGWVSVHFNVKYEHPNYATIIYYGRDKHTEIILPNSVTLVASSKGEYVANIGDNIRTNVTTEEILLELKLCSTCLQKSINKLNIKPLYYKSRLNPHKTELLRTTDSFKKVFIVNYAGQCFRNVKYQKGRVNLAGCKNHANSENQKLFILTRCLMGCKLWDIDSYRSRITEAKRAGTSIHETESRVEIRNYVNKPYHEKYLILYHEPTLVLTKNKPKEYPPRELAYVTRQVINDLPEVGKLYPIYSALLEVCSKKGAKVSEPIMGEFAIFLNQVVDDILGKHRRASDGIKKEPEILSHPDLRESIPFHVRYQRWLKQCAEYWKEIREQYVPKYFISKYFHSVAGTLLSDQVESSNSSNEALPICQCKENIGAPDSSLCDCGKIGFTNPYGSFVKTVHTITTDEPLKTTDQQNKLTNDPLTDSETIPPQRLVSDNCEPSSAEKIIPIPSDFVPFAESPSAAKTSAVSSSRPVSGKDSEPPSGHQTNPTSTISLTPEKIQTCWCKTELGKRILAEIRTRIVKIAVEMTTDRSVEVSADKIEDATKRLLSDLLVAVRKYETNTCKEDYITISANAAVENILQMQLNAIELILLLDNVERVAVSEEIPILCSPALDTTVTGGSSLDLPNRFESCKASSSGMQENQLPVSEDESPYFGVYGYYSDTYVSKPKPAEKSPTATNLTTVFEKDQSQTKSASLNGQDGTCEHANLDTPCESKVPFQIDKYYERCEKCADYAKSVQTEPSSSASAKRSRSQVTFSAASVQDDTKTILLPANPTMSSMLTTFNTFIVAKSSDSLLTNIELSPTSSLLEYCLSENLARIDGSTMVLQKSDFDDSASMMVSFSVASLKDKEVEKPLPGPYVQRNPDEAAEDIENIIARTKTMKIAQESSNYQRFYENSAPSQGETINPLLKEESLHNCRECIMQLDEELSKSDSLSRFKTKSVACLLAALKRTELDDLLSSTDKEKITTSLVSIIEGSTARPRAAKCATGSLVSAISDEDAVTAKGSQSVLTASRAPRQEATRRSVGSQTQAKVDRMNQSSSLRFNNSRSSL